jgi:hypothetical protein
MTTPTTPQADRFRFRVPIICGDCGEKAFQLIEWDGQMFAEYEITKPPCCGKWGINGLPQGCTGLRDKNGTLIWEGDILRSVQDNNQMTGIDSCGNERYLPNCGIAPVSFMFGMWFLDEVINNSLFDVLEEGCFCEVVGNIYQDSHLLNP